MAIVILGGPVTGLGGTRDRRPAAKTGDVIDVITDPDDVDDILLVGYDQDIRVAGLTFLILTVVVATALWATRRRVMGQSSPASP